LSESSVFKITIYHIILLYSIIKFNNDYCDKIIHIDIWFIAYLINQVGIDNYRVNFYDDLNELGFEGSFVENFGKSSGEFLDEFHAFLHLDIENQLEIIP